MINLVKGQRVAVSATKFTVGLGWDVNEAASGGEFDLDASVFMLGENKHLISDEFFVFYHNLESPDGAAKHTGDNRTGEGDGDDESIVIDLTRIDPRVNELIFVVSIYDAEARRQNFGQVNNSFIRIYNTETGEEIMRYELEEDFSVETSVEFGRLYRRNGEWRFGAIGQGQKADLGVYVDKYR